MWRHANRLVVISYILLARTYNKTPQHAFQAHQLASCSPIWSAGQAAGCGLQGSLQSAEVASGMTLQSACMHAHVMTRFLVSRKRLHCSRHCIDVPQATVWAYLAFRCWRIACAACGCGVVFQQVDEKLAPVVSTGCAIKEPTCTTEIRSCTYVPCSPTACWLKQQQHRLPVMEVSATMRFCMASACTLSSMLPIVWSRSTSTCWHANACWAENAVCLTAPIGPCILDTTSNSTPGSSAQCDGPELGLAGQSACVHSACKHHLGLSTILRCCGWCMLMHINQKPVHAYLSVPVGVVHDDSICCL